MARVLFVCRQNAGRSQMSEAIFRLRAGGVHDGRSAGTEPADSVHPQVVGVMHELDVDLSDRIPKKLEPEDAEWADVVITMGCGDACPVIPGKEYVDWDLPDPAGRSLDEVREIREKITRRVEELLVRLSNNAVPD